MVLIRQECAGRCFTDPNRISLYKFTAVQTRKVNLFKEVKEGELMTSHHQYADYRCLLVKKKKEIELSDQLTSKIELLREVIINQILNKGYNKLQYE
jgi:hypothetical protein